MTISQEDEPKVDYKVTYAVAGDDFKDGFADGYSRGWQECWEYLRTTAAEEVNEETCPITGVKMEGRDEI